MDEFHIHFAQYNQYTELYKMFFSLALGSFVLVVIGYLTYEGRK